MDAQFNIGKLIDGTARRDAVHFALSPAVAAERLSPGQHISLGDHGATGEGSHIGIVDPFLPGPVFPGDQFWLFLYPNTITSLRHEWEHPAFTGEMPPKTEATSEEWLKDFANDMGVSYDRMMSSADCWIQSGEYLTLNYDTPDRAYTDSADFWKHYQNVTGKQGPEDDRDTFFTCAC